MMESTLNEGLTENLEAMELEPVGDAGGTGSAREPGPRRRRCSLQFVQVAVVMVMMLLVLMLYQVLHSLLTPGEDFGPADAAFPAGPAAEMASPTAELGAVTSQSSGADFVCGGDAVAVGSDAGKEMTSQTWTQQRDERVRVKLWGAGGMGGPPVRLTPEGGCGSEPEPGRRLRRRGGGYRGTGTRADLNNHANQMNPNNWRYWSSRGMSPPWRSTGSGSYAPYMAPRVAPAAPMAAAAESGGAGQSAADTGGSTFRFRRGLPLPVLRQWARRAMKAARKWLPRQRRWKVSRSDPTSVGPCGELWLCGGGGGGGAFTDVVVNLTAGKRYALQVGVGGFPGSPRGGATRLAELDDDGSVVKVLAKAQGGFGATAVDEERLVALGGAGAPASDAAGLEWSQPGIDGEASRSSFEDLDPPRLPLVGANLTVAKAMPLSELNLSLAALRIPCAGAVKEGAAEYEAGLTGELTSIKYDAKNAESIPGARVFAPYSPSVSQTPKDVWRKEEPVTDHMLVCLPSDGLANSYDSKTLYTGDLYLMDEKCARDDFNLDQYGNQYGQQGPLTVQLDGQTYYVAKIVDIPGKRLIMRLVYHNFQSEQYNSRQVYYEKDSACLVHYYGVGLGSQCFGSACVRGVSSGPCEGLASCLDGLAMWSGIWKLGNGDRVEMFSGYSAGRYVTLKAPTSSSGPKGGISTATPNGRPAGHGGSGACPELLRDMTKMAPLQDVAPRHAAPQRGEDGMAMFYKCST